MTVYHYTGFAQVVTQDDSDYEDPDRLYHPPFNLSGNINSFLTFDPATQVSHLRTRSTPYGGLHPDDRRTIFVATDGGCKYNGTTYARAAAGVYFGPRSQYNVSELLPEHMRQTSQMAELHAVQKALTTVRQNLNYDPFFTVVIMSDSNYVVKGFTDWIFRWQENGFIDAYNGQPIVKKPKFQQIQALIENLERERMDVKFLKVERADNSYADALAGAPLRNY